MLFEVWKDGECKMATDYLTCIYSDEILKSMAKEGYTFKFKGKKISVKNLISERRII